MQLKKVDASSIGNTEVLWVAKKLRNSEILRLEMVEKNKNPYSKCFLTRKSSISSNVIAS